MRMCMVVVVGATAERSSGRRQVRCACCEGRANVLQTRQSVRVLPKPANGTAQAPTETSVRTTFKMALPARTHAGYGEGAGWVFLRQIREPHRPMGYLPFCPRQQNGCAVARTGEQNRKK